MEDKVLSRFAGREAELFERLQSKYVLKKAPPSAVARRYGDAAIEKRRPLRASSSRKKEASTHERTRGKATRPRQRDMNARSRPHTHVQQQAKDQIAKRAANAIDISPAARTPSQTTPTGRGSALRNAINRFRGPVTSPADRRVREPQQQSGFWWQGGKDGSSGSTTRGDSTHSRSPRTLAPATAAVDAAASAALSTPPQRRSPINVDDVVGWEQPPSAAARARSRTPPIKARPASPPAAPPAASLHASPAASQPAAPANRAPSQPRNSSAVILCESDAPPTSPSFVPSPASGPAATAANTAATTSSFDELELRGARLLGRMPTSVEDDTSTSWRREVVPVGRERLRLFAPSTEIEFEDPAAIIARLRQRLGLSPPSVSAALAPAPELSSDEPVHHQPHLPLAALAPPVVAVGRPAAENAELALESALETPRVADVLRAHIAALEREIAVRG